jgi:N-acetylmuramoyl-L-alanine amidase
VVADRRGRLVRAVVPVVATLGAVVVVGASAMLVGGPDGTGQQVAGQPPGPAVTMSARATGPTAGLPVAHGTAEPLVVLDPGHNGRNQTPAALDRLVPDGRGGRKACNTDGTSTDAGYPEHAFTWDVALRARDILVAHGVQVLLTRADDVGTGPCVDQRAAIGNRPGVRAVVAIHADGAAPAGQGFHIALSDPPLNPAQGEPAHRLAGVLHDALLTAGFRPSTYLGVGGLLPRPDLAGLNLSTVPAVLLECANMRNPAEAALVSTAAGRDRYAAAVAEGVLAYLG